MEFRKLSMKFDNGIIGKNVVKVSPVFLLFFVFLWKTAEFPVASSSLLVLVSVLLLTHAQLSSSANSNLWRIFHTSTVFRMNAALNDFFITIWKRQGKAFHIELESDVMFLQVNINNYSYLSPEFCYVFKKYQRPLRFDIDKCSHTR